jgi:hypothetical protein
VSAGKGDLIPLSDTFGTLSPDDVRLELQKCKPNSIPILIIDEFDKLEDKYAITLTANVIKSLADYSVSCTVIIVGISISRYIQSCSVCGTTEKSVGTGMQGCSLWLKGYK